VFGPRHQSARALARPRVESVAARADDNSTSPANELQAEQPLGVAEEHLLGHVVGDVQLGEGTEPLLAASVPNNTRSCKRPLISRTSSGANRRCTRTP
jgi:hypothetical protein